ncbi:MAG: DNA alkylation repair protein [Thermoplasmata archaeon]|nr:DNA alkylation repair protein [Thermoplasmata archaeon]
MKDDIEAIVADLRALTDPSDREGMARFGIDSNRAMGTRMPVLRKYAKGLGRDHDRALRLWDRGLRETMVLAALTDDPAEVTAEQADRWVSGLYDWESCDQTCLNLLWRTPFAHEKAVEWTFREGEFEKRAGFALMAVLAVKDKKSDDAAFERFFPLIEREATDPRNGVRKAVNWALRQIGKRNAALNARAIEVGERIASIDDRTARWVARDALMELRSEAVRERLMTRGSRATPGRL